MIAFAFSLISRAAAVPVLVLFYVFFIRGA